MERYVNILYRLARFLAVIPPDAAKYLPAVFERTDLLVAFGLWAANAVAGEVFTSLLVLLFALYLWPKLPTGVQSFLLSVRDFLFPGAYDTEGESGNGNENSREIEDLREELEMQRAQIGEMNRRTDCLEQELEKALRPWWRRFFDV